MNSSSLLLFAGLISALCTIVACGDKPKAIMVTYPETRMDSSVVDTLWGEAIPDPYRWLEDDLSDETAAWVKAQNEVTFGYLEQIPFREALRSRLEKVWNYERFSAPFKEGKYTYFYKNDGLQNQSVLYRQAEGVEEAEVFLDPNAFSADGTTSLAGVSFSKDGSLLAYQISEGGSDWRKVIIMDAESKQILEDTLIDVKFSGISWFGNDGFYYSSYDRPKGSELSAMTDKHKLLYHKLGTPQSTDQLIFGGERTPRRYIYGSVTEDQQYLIIGAAISTTGNELYIQDLRRPGSAIRPIVSNFDNSHQVVTTLGEQIYIETNLNAPNRKVVVAQLNKPGPENWRDLIPETDMPLDINSAGEYLFASYLQDALSKIIQFDMAGKQIREVGLPGPGSAGGFSAKKDDQELYYSFTNYVYPTTIFKFDMASGASSLYKKPDILFDPEQYESKQVFYTSKDGTKVPMMITHKKGIQLNGQNPTILYGYGGFNISLTPSFSTANIVWLENGGVYAVANLRGGGEYGKAWHDGGRQLNKQNVFDDFISAAEYLVSTKYTVSDKLAIAGGSNGGLLVAACMAQRPDLFQVALPAVGVLDMLRYHKFTAGAGWAYDYGTADESEEMFRYLLGYSPLHNLKENTNYPATMVTTADHDDRVVPAHSFKFAARLQATTSGERPALIRIDVKAGHGAGKPTSMIIQERADIYAFTLYNMGFHTFKPIQ
jgi:prolyl oligopeptidase